MYTLTIDNYQLILDPDFGVPLLYKNPCWCFNEIPAPLVPDVTIPDNDVNRNRLGHPGRFAKMAKSNDRKFKKAELRWGGYLLIYGTLIITSASQNGYSGYIQSQLRSLSDLQREKLISDHHLLGELTFQNKPDYNPLIDLYCTIRLQNAGFWIDKGELEEWTKVTQNGDGTTTSQETEREILTRKFEETVEYLVNYPTPSGVKTEAGENEVVVVSPYPFLSRLIELLLQENKFFIRNNYLDENEILRTLCLYNNISICKPEQVTQTIETTLWDKFHIQTSYAGTVAYVYQVESQLWTTENFKLNKLLPKIKLNELLLSVQNLTNTFLHPTGIDDVDIIDRESLFDIAPFDLSPYRVSGWLPGTRHNKILKFGFQHDSDDQEFNENFTDITSREEDIKDPVVVYADLAALYPEPAEGPAIGEIRLVASEKMYYEYRQELVDEKNVLMWAPLTIDIQDYKYNTTGDETEEIKTLFSTLRMHDNGYPVAYQKGNNSQFSQYVENFTPRLMFYNGNNTGGSAATSGLSMNWQSLIESRYRRTAPFYANALPVEADFRFPGNIFYKVLNEIYKPFLDKDGSFFIKEMQVNDSNNQFISATLIVFKNEDNVFESTTNAVDGGGEHAGVTFTPKFVGVTESGWPILVDAAGLQRPMPAFGDLSNAAFSAYTCSDYSAADKLLFVGGDNGQLHVCDLSDMENIRYKTIQLWGGGASVSGVAVIDNGTGKQILIGQASGSSAWAMPYHPVWEDYGMDMVHTQFFDHGTGHVRAFMWYNGFYYACTSEGEVFRTPNFSTMWSQLADIDANNAAFIQISQTATRIWVAEVNDDSLSSEKSDPTDFFRFDGLAGSKRQKVRNLQPLLNDDILWMCDDDGECIWKIGLGVSNGNITPAGIKNAGGACFDGSKYAYISVRDNSGYTKIARFNADIEVPEAMWSYLNVSSFFSKLFLY